MSRVGILSPKNGFNVKMSPVEQGILFVIGLSTDGLSVCFSYINLRTLTGSRVVTDFSIDE